MKRKNERARRGGAREKTAIEHPERLYFLRLQCVRRTRFARWLR